MEELRQRIYSESNVHGVRLKRYMRFHSKKIQISWIREHVKFELIHLTFGDVYICLLHVTAITTFNEIKKDFANRSIFDGLHKQSNKSMFSPYHITKLFFVFIIRDQVNSNISKIFSCLLLSCCAAPSFWFRYAQDYRHGVCGLFIDTIWQTKNS